MIWNHAIVVGGGPAGLSAAIGLARAGFSVRLFDRRKEWSGRVCGSFLSPAAPPHLEWLGLLNQVRRESAPCDHATLCRGEESVRIPISRNGVTGLAIPRKRLEEILTGEASRLGVEFKFGSLVEEITLNDDGSCQVKIQYEDSRRSDELECGVAVCADGRFSNFRRREQKNSPEKKRELSRGWFGWNVEFKQVNQLPGELSLHFFPEGYIGTLTFNNGITNVSGLIHSELKKKANAGWDQFISILMKRDRNFRQRFKDAVQNSTLLGVPALPFGRFIQEDQTIFLAGDAAAVCDPFMGEGISRALSAGPMLFSVFQIRGRNLPGVRAAHKDYFRLWRTRYGLRQKMGIPIRGMMRNDWTIASTINLVSRWPWIQKGLLSVIHAETGRLF